MSTAYRINSPWGTSADSNPSSSKALTPSIPAAAAASTGSNRRQLAGQSLVWTMRRAASAPAAKVGKVTPADARNTGRAWMRIQASVMMPRMPSLPIAIRSGLGPAPLPGRRRDSQRPDGVTIRTDSTMSSICVWLVA